MRREAASCLAMLPVLCGCSASLHTRCQVGEQPAVLDSLYFGGEYVDGVVSAGEWQSFVDRVVTPRFPEGLTVVQGRGQYRTAAGVIQHEPSWVLQLVHPEDAASEAAITQIRTAYQTEFKQEAVLRVRSQACVSF